MTNPMATALELAPLIERVHGPNHPELTRVRELTFAIDLSWVKRLSALSWLV